MSEPEQHSEQGQPDYVGAPTEYANAQEVPGWVATLVKALATLPVGLSALTLIQLGLVILILACVVLFVLLTFAF
ncbi:MAG: hypothetical protein JW963_10430 [Anaerolineales bacterium]|nr:hypothetical protein [Anaerolineales bacterium]